MKRKFWIALAVLLGVWSVVAPVYLSSQSTLFITRSTNGAIRIESGSAIPFAENVGIHCDETGTGDNFTCSFTGGGLRGDLVEDFDELPIASGQNFSTIQWDATIGAEQDASPETMVVGVTDGVIASTATELFDEYGAFSTTHPVHVYRYYVGDYDGDTDAGRLVHQAETGNLTLETTDAAGQAEAAERADFDCPQVRSIKWHTFDLNGDSDSDGPDSSTGSHILRMLVNGSDGSSTLCTIAKGSSTGECNSGSIPAYGWNENDLIALKIDCPSCTGTVAQEFYVRVVCY